MMLQKKLFTEQEVKELCEKAKEILVNDPNVV